MSKWSLGGDPSLYGGRLGIMVQGWEAEEGVERGSGDDVVRWGGKGRRQD